MSGRWRILRTVAGIVFTLTIMQWILRLILVGQTFARSGFAGVKAEFMDASIGLTRDVTLSWEGAVAVQAALVLLTVVSGVVFFRKSRVPDGK